jgi:hypothetical protein
MDGKLMDARAQKNTLLFARDIRVSFDDRAVKDRARMTVRSTALVTLYNTTAVILLVCWGLHGRDT